MGDRIFSPGQVLVESVAAAGEAVRQAIRDLHVCVHVYSLEYRVKRVSKTGRKWKKRGKKYTE